LRDRRDEFEAFGASLAAIGLGKLAEARAFREEARIPFPLLVDEKRVAYRAAGLKEGSLFDLLRPAEILARLRARSRGHRQGKLGSNPLQLGGSFVFGPGDTDLYARPSRFFGDTPTAEELLAAVRSARRPA
jgi:hypothetical protein